ncbi:MAG: hypothetical protein RLZZ210_350 [Pseudomonadota bacterium]|jgi:hypothetical protein
MTNEIKYAYLYKYLPPNVGSLRVISKQTIKFTNPADFNDPFDCVVSLERYFNNFNDYKIGYYKNRGKKVSDNQLRVMYANYKNKVKNEGLTNEPLKNYGVLCLSEEPLDILMWSHYAQNHKGFVVEFKLPIVKNNGEYPLWDKNIKCYLWEQGNLIAKSVDYVDKYNYWKLDLDQSEKDKLALEIIYRKYNVWAYEKEVRVFNRFIEKLSKNRILEYPSENLVSVIAGCKMEADFLEELKKSCGIASKKLGRYIRIYYANHKANSYALEITTQNRIKKNKKKVIKSSCNFAFYNK